MPYAFEIHRDKKEEFRVRFKAPNGENMFSSEGYSSKAAAKNAIKSLLKNAPAAEVIDSTKAVKAAKKAAKGAKAAGKKVSKKTAKVAKKAKRAKKK